MDITILSVIVVVMILIIIWILIKSNKSVTLETKSNTTPREPYDPHTQKLEEDLVKLEAEVAKLTKSVNIIYAIVIIGNIVILSLLAYGIIWLTA